MAQLEVTCPPCGTVMTADSVEELIPIVKEHARKEHQYQMTDDEVRASVVHREASND